MGSLEETSEMPNKLPFTLGIGVGCLWLARRPEDTREIKQHFQYIRDDLSSIENLTDLEMDGEDGQYGSLVEFEDGETYEYPNTYWVRISFTLYIPEKVQERLDAVCGRERLSVIIANHYHSPVTYVIGETSSDDFDPSTGIVLVRRYLEEKLKDSSLKFGSIGPSPFHARF